MDTAVSPQPASPPATDRSSTPWGDLRRWARLFPDGAPLDPDVQAGFEGWSTDLTRRASPWFLVFFMVVAALWWPTDLLIFAGMPDVQLIYAGLRGSVIALHLFWLTLGRGLLDRAPVRVGVFIALSEATIAGALMGLAGGLDGPWAHYMYVLPWVSVCLARPFFERCCGAFGLGGLSLGACLLVAGTPLDHPLLLSTISMMVFCAAFAAIVGHGAWLLLRENYVQQRLIDDQRRRLAAFSDELEARVAEQTRDLQVLTRRLETVQEQERGWMARELHDALGQEMTAARYALDLARSRLTGDDRKVDRALADIHHRLGLAHDSIRRILHRLRPRVLDELGLVAALRWLGDEAAETAELDVAVYADPDDIRLAAAVQSALYRMAQEAVANVLRHAEARTLQIRLTADDGRLELMVADDGIGHVVARERSADPNGAGCIGIRERATGLGGRATWHAPPTGGTEVRVCIPLEDR